MSHHGHTRLSGWDIYLDGCLHCGTTEKRHRGHGLCNTCATRAYRHKHPDRMTEYRATYFSDDRKDARNTKKRAQHAIDHPTAIPRGPRQRGSTTSNPS
jgi:uncharacterized Zn finger protein (UPF0148 family)